MLIVRVDGPGGRDYILPDQSVEDVLRIDPKGRDPVVRKLDKDTFRSLTENVDLLDARHVKQILAQPLLPLG